MFHVCIYYTVLSVPFNPLRSAGLLALLCLIFPCVFVTFPYGVSGTVGLYLLLIFDFFFTFNWVKLVFIMVLLIIYP